MTTRNAFKYGAIRTNIVLSLIDLVLLLGLSGCFKAEVSIDVKPNGSGIMSFAIGMTQQAKAFVASDDTDPAKAVKQTLATGDSAPEDVKVMSWIDGDYEWTKAEKEFANLDEINNALHGNKLFNNFSLTRNHRLLRDEYILEAELVRIDSNSSGNNFNVDPAAFIQMSFSARLPGKIMETNGLQDVNDPNRMVWNVASKKAVAIHARSVTWNWVSISAIAGLILLFGVVAVGSIGYLVYAGSHKSETVNVKQPGSSLEIPTADFEGLGIEKLLLEINDTVLKSAGQIQKTTGKITLVWKNRLNQQRIIEIKALDGDQISINDQVIPATKERAKTAIIDALRKQVKSPVVS
jgi:hypothetical protein